MKKILRKNSKTYYSKDEQETICIFTAETNQWRIYSCAQRHLGKLFKKYGKPKQAEYRNGKMISATWEVPSYVISFRSPVKRKGGNRGAHLRKQRSTS